MRFFLCDDLLLVLVELGVGDDKISIPLLLLRSLCCVAFLLLLLLLSWSSLESEQ